MTKYSLPLFARLEPRTGVFEGGRLADTDMLRLGEAAEMATVHAGRTVRVSDFLRAGARGELRLLAIVPRAATLLPMRATDEPVQAVAGAFTHLPMSACASLATLGTAEWRSIEGMERSPAGGGDRAFFDRWRLPDDEPSFTVTLEGVRVMGRDVHALADAFLSVADPVPTAPQVEPMAAELVPAVVAADVPLPLPTGDVAFSFDGLRYSEAQWKKPLGNKPKWLKECVAIPGRRGVSETRWNPVLIGAALVHRGYVEARSVRARFQTKHLLTPWLEAWKTYEADHIESA